MTRAAAPPSATVIVLTYNSERDVETCFGSLERERALTPGFDVIAVDNASADGTVRAIRAKFPWVELIENASNLGFAEGNNVGIRCALERGARYVYLLNPDTEVTPGFLDEAVRVAEARPECAAVQSLLLLARTPERINTLGNRIHFLGFGSCGGYGARVEDAPANPVSIAYASGAAVLLRADALREVGLFDEELFLYHEDLDLGLRLRLAGHDIVLAPKSRVLHRYEFSRNTGKYYFMERNRYLVLLKHLAPRTLAVLGPALAAAEGYVLIEAARGGWLERKLRADRELLRLRTWRYLLAARKESSRHRQVTDSELATVFSPTMEFEGVVPPVVSSIVNPVLKVVWSGLSRLV